MLAVINGFTAAYAVPAPSSCERRTANDVNFKGWIDNLMILNRAITPAEVAAYQANGAVALVSTIAAKINNAARLGNRSFQFGFTNTAYSSFTVYATTNLTAPFNKWSNLGPAVETPASSGPVSIHRSGGDEQRATFLPCDQSVNVGVLGNANGPVTRAVNAAGFRQSPLPSSPNTCGSTALKSREKLNGW